MGVVEIIFGIILLLFSIAIILVVLLQEGHQQNVGAVMGGADTFLSKNKSRSVDAFLSRWTKFIALGFFSHWSLRSTSSCISQNNICGNTPRFGWASARRNAGLLFCRQLRRNLNRKGKASAGRRPGEAKCMRKSNG